MMYLGVGLFASILFRTLCAFCFFFTLCFLDLHVYFIHQIREVFFHYFHRFPISCSFSSPSGTPVRQMLGRFKLSQKLLILSLFFEFFFHLVVLHGCIVFRYVPNHWFDPQLYSLYCCFPINYSLFQSVYPSFRTGSFLYCWHPHYVPWAAL